MKIAKSQFLWWSVVLLVLACATIVGGFCGDYLYYRATTGTPWREIPPPPNERAVALLAAEFPLVEYEDRLCVRTESGLIYLWQNNSVLKYKELPQNHWQLLSPLPDGDKLKQVILPFVSYSPPLGGAVLVTAESENNHIYAWQSGSWHLIQNILPYEGRDNKEGTDFHAFVDPPKLQGKAIDKINVSTEGIAWWVRYYVLMEDGRLMLSEGEAHPFLGLARIAGRVVCVAGGVVVGVVAGVLPLIILLMRRPQKRPQ